MKPIEGEPAFPHGPLEVYDEAREKWMSVDARPGMSLRQYYIGKALMGICANPNRSHWKANGAAAEAIKIADAVMQLLYPQTEKETN